MYSWISQTIQGTKGSNREHITQQLTSVFLVSIDQTISEAQLQETFPEIPAQTRSDAINALSRKVSCFYLPTFFSMPLTSLFPRFNPIDSFRSLSSLSSPSVERSTIELLTRPRLPWWVEWRKVKEWFIHLSKIVETKVSGRRSFKRGIRRPCRVVRLAVWEDWMRGQLHFHSTFWTSAFWLSSNIHFLFQI